MVGNGSQSSANLITHACEFAEAESESESVSVSDTLAKTVSAPEPGSTKAFKIHATVPFGSKIFSDNLFSENAAKYVETAQN
jgi:hypothetical protein